MPTATELAVTQTSDATLLAETIFGDGITVVSATLTGAASQSGIYTGGETTSPGTVPSDSGVIFSTGNVADYTNSDGTTNTNTSAGLTTDYAGAGDADLTALSGNATFDAVVFEAIFIPDNDFLTMQFTFSSEEYLEYVNGGVNDALGVWVNGVFTPLTPTGDTVSIDTVNNTVNSNLYVDNPDFADTYNTEMDGFTVTLSFKAPVNVGVENTIKIGLADGGDGAYDSNVLIAADSAQTVALAFSDQIEMAPNSSAIIDVLANDFDASGLGLTVTKINGTDVVAGNTVTLGTGEQVTLNLDGTLTVLTDSDITSSAFTYEVTDANSVTDVGYVTINTVAAPSPDGYVDGTVGGDLIDASYIGDPNGDLVDNNDALGVASTVGDGDVIRGFGGNDTILAGAGDDIVDGGDGNDIVWGGEGNDSILGGAGNDTLNGNAGADTIDGGDGADSLHGGQGGDSIAGGADADFILGDGQWYTLSDYASVTSGAATTLTVTNSADGPIQLWWIDGSGVQQFYATIQPGDTFVQPTFEDHNWILQDENGRYLELIEGAANQTVIYGAEGLADSISGGDGADTIYGQFGDDTIDGGDGDDELYGGTGNDTLNTGNGNDVAYGGDGNDSIVGGTNVSGSQALFGDAGDDTIAAGDSTLIYGGTGNDLITGSDLLDQLIGDEGNDTLFGAGGGDQLSGDAGDDALYGGDGLDFLDGGADNDTLYGGTDGAADQLYAGTGNDLIYAGAGDNTLVYGGDGDDTIHGDAGNDLLQSEVGNDQIFGGTGNDSAAGGDGNDLLDGGDGADFMGGEAGNDTLIGGLGADSLYGGDDADVIYGGAGDVVVGGEGVTTGTDNDTLILNYADVESITYGGGNNEAGMVTFTAASGGGTLTFSEIENINFAGPVDGSAGDDAMGPGYTDAQGDQVDGADGLNDTIFGYGGNDSITAGAGNDTVYGGDGADTLIGQDGDDLVFGEAGNDSIRVSAGNDTVDAGIDNDTVVVTESSGTSVIDGGLGTDTIDFATELEPSGWTITATGDGAGTGTHSSGSAVTYTNFETILGSSNDDLFDLSADTNGAFAIADAGNDTLIGGIGADNLRGREGDDSLVGGAGADTLSGGADNDTLLGGTGADSLTGGDGDDTFLLENSFGNDTIIGGELAETAGDTLDLSAVTTATTIDLTNANPETGTVSDGTSTAAFSEIENIILGAGTDTLVLADGGGSDTVAGFTAPIDNGDGTFTGQDQLDVTGLTDANGAIVNTSDVTVTDDAAGNVVLTFPGGESLTLIGVTPAQLSTPQQLAAIGIPQPDFIVDGTAGDDTIDASYLGDPQGDMIDGFDHFDGSNVDVIEAGAGNDSVLSGAGNDSVYGEDGNDTLDGGDGDDFISGATGADLLLGGAGNDNLNGGAGNDTLDGGIGNDNLSGGTGADSLIGGDGNDSIFAGSENDTIFAGAGNDALYAGTGNDLIDAGAGIDYIQLTSGNDTVTTGDDSDNIDVFQGGYVNGAVVTVDGGAGGVDSDTLDLAAWDAYRNLSSTTDPDGNSTSGTVELLDAAGNWITVNFTEIENLLLPATDLTPDEIVEGTAGADLIDTGYLGDPEGDMIDAGDNSAGNDDDSIEAGAGNDTVLAGLGADVVTAGDGDDQIFGGAGSDTVFGGADNDLIFGDEGNDSLEGGLGADNLFGGAGNDTILGGEGDDQMFGGDEIDLFVIEDNFGSDSVTGGEAGTDFDTIDLSAVTTGVSVTFTGTEAGTLTNSTNTITFTEIESLILTDQDDIVDTTQDDGPTFIYGGGGNDTFVVGAGFDGMHIDGGADGDLIDLNSMPNPVQVVFSGPGAGTITDLVTGDVMTFENIQNLILTEQADIVNAGLDDGSTYIELRSGDDNLTGSDGGAVYDDFAFDPNGQGNDTFNGGGGDDSIWAGTDDDLVFGGAGNDQLNGQEGNDTLSGGEGNDSISGSFDNDLIMGGDGNDLLTGDDAASGGIITDGDTVAGTSGQDAAIWAGDTGTSATISLDDGGGTANDGDDVRDVVFVTGTGDGANLTLQGFDYGSDWITTAEQWTASTVTEIAPGNHLVTLTYANGNTQSYDIFHDNGSVFTIDDAFAVYAGNDSIDGGAGDDVVFGGEGDDTIGLGANDGADTIVGGEDADGTDRDVLDIYDAGSGQGATVLYTANEGGTVAFDGAPGAISTFANIEVMDGTNEADLIDASVTTNGVEVYSNWGNDTVIGGSGDDTIYAGRGDDSVFGGDGNDILTGQEGTDTINGGAGNDTLTGNEGSDFIEGGDGDDLMIGDGPASSAGGQFGIFALGSAGSTSAMNNGTFAFTASAGSTTVQVADDETAFEDLNSLGGSTPDTGRPQVLTQDITIGSTTYLAGTTIHAIAQSDIVNSTTGETGNAWLIQIGPVEAGNLYWSFDIPVHDGDQITWTSSDVPGEQSQPYADTTGLQYIDLVQADGQPAASNDTLVGGSGNDTLFGGMGNDSLSGGDDADSISGDSGNDWLAGEFGDDTIDGGDGADSIFGGTGNDLLMGGAGNDSIEGWFGDDTLFGGSGDDYLDGSDGADTLIGGDGNDTLLAGSDASNDSLDGGDGNDELSAGGGDDTLFGGAGADNLFAAEGNDILDGGDGDDTLQGWLGNDSIDGGAGDDVILGGDGNDTFSYAAGDGLDTIFDFNSGNTGTLNDGDFTNNDFINLSGFYDNIAELQDDYADDGILNQSNSGVTIWGQVVDYSNNTSFDTDGIAGNEGIAFLGQSPDGTSFTQENTGVICFTSGTAIRTPAGQVLIDHLKIGDLVTTADNGPQRIMWIGKTCFGPEQLSSQPNLRPILIRRGVLGVDRDLLVSPQHGMLIDNEHLARATHLAASVKGIRRANGRKEVTYFHLMFAKHEVIFAENAPSESFYPGLMALSMMDATARGDLLTLLPQLVTARTIGAVTKAYGPPARVFAHKTKIAQMMQTTADDGGSAYSNPPTPLIPQRL